MIGTKYTPGLLAELAKTPHLRSMEIPTTPEGQKVASIVAYFDKDSLRFGFVLDHDVDKVTVSTIPEGLCVSFTVHTWIEEGLDKRTVVLSGDATVEVMDDVEAVSVVEETNTGLNKVTSFFYDETSSDPWLVIIETVE